MEWPTSLCNSFPVSMSIILTYLSDFGTYTIFLPSGVMQSNFLLLIDIKKGKERKGKERRGKERGKERKTKREEKGKKIRKSEK